MAHKLGTFSKFPKLSGLSLLIFWWWVGGGHAAACGILVPGPGVEPVTPVVESQSLNPLTSREVLELLSFVCMTLLHPMDCSLPGSSVLGIPQQEYWMGCHFHLQGIFPCLLPWQVDSLPLHHLGSPGKFCPHLQYRDSNIPTSEN